MADGRQLPLVLERGFSQLEKTGLDEVTDSGNLPLPLLTVLLSPEPARTQDLAEAVKQGAYITRHLKCSVL